MREQLATTRRKLKVGRRPLAALLNVSPSELLEIERGHREPPAGFEERLLDLQSKAEVVRDITSDGRFARRVGTTLIESITIFFGSVGVLVVIADPDTSPRDRLIVLGLAAVATFFLLRATSIVPRCSECGASTGWLRTACARCNRTFLR